MANIEKLRQTIPAPLFQLHHQYKDGKTEFVAQSEIRNLEEMKFWHDDVAERHPLPDGCQWMICNEKSKYFMRAAD